MAERSYGRQIASIVVYRYRLFCYIEFRCASFLFPFPPNCIFIISLSMMNEQSNLTIQCEDRFDPWSATANLVLTSLFLMILALNYLKKKKKSILYFSFNIVHLCSPLILFYFFFTFYNFLCFA